MKRKAATSTAATGAATTAPVTVTATATATAKSSQKPSSRLTVACPIVVGSVATYLGKKAGEYATHRWSLYVRGPQNEDISTFVSKVTFLLHPSFAEPLREVPAKAPKAKEGASSGSGSWFAVSETGWGEFESVITLYFRDPDEAPLKLHKQLKLYPPGVPASGTLSKKPVISESYDEILFTNPKESFRQCLLAYGSTFVDPVPQLPPMRSIDHFDDEKDIAALTQINNFLCRNIETTKSQLIHTESEIAYLESLRDKVTGSS